ncbi:hypothetical protein DFQ27_003899 [Actinomortierella ambigua]|uniref:Uncharacterized protein n=1 Tax=Actinomortierella ambigua TaxID=1343610 RepID=A0A9P6U4Y0_9FUNG|nr:hypothetical protein DFQ27_003899 [Actinomortierella ambigua]
MNTDHDKWQEVNASLEAASRATNTENTASTSLPSVGPSVAPSKEQLDSLDVFQKLVEDQFKTSSQLSITKALESDPVILEAATGLGIPHNQMVVNTSKGLSFVVLQNALELFIQSHSAAIGVKFLLNNHYQYKKRSDKGSNTTVKATPTTSNNDDSNSSNGNNENNNKNDDDKDVINVVENEKQNEQAFHDSGYAVAALTGVQALVPIAAATTSMSIIVPTVGDSAPQAPLPLQEHFVPQVQEGQEQQQQQQQQSQQPQPQQQQQQQIAGPQARMRYRFRCHRASTKSVHKGRVPGGKSGKTRCVKASIKCGCEATIAAVSDNFRVYGDQNQQVDSVPIYRVVYKAAHNHSLNATDPSAPAP